MTTIKNGYGGKPVHIRIDGRELNEKAELWLEQEGLKKYGYGRDEKLYELEDTHSETLSFITIDEAILLRNELNEAIKTMAGL